MSANRQPGYLLALTEGKSMKGFPTSIGMLAGLLLAAGALSGAQAAGVTLVTHGNQPTGQAPEWTAFMADAIGSENIGGTWTRYRLVIDDPGWDALRATAVPSGAVPTECASGEIVIELDWSQVAGGLLIPDYSTADIAEKIVECLTDPEFFPGLGRPAVELPLHLAGHSRGGVLTAQIAELLGRRGIWVSQVTTLDPVPLPKDTLAGAFPMRLTENVLFADNYIQTIPASIIAGSRLQGSYPRPAWDDPDDLANGYTNAHSDVHLWYHGTIDLRTPVSDGIGAEAQTITSAMRADTGWWSPAEEQGTRTGFYFSRLRGGTYDGGSRSDVGYTPPTSPFREVWTIASTGAEAWDNVEITAAGPATVFQGDSIEIDTWFFDLNNDAAITWGLDPDSQNPYSDSAMIELESLPTSSIPFAPGESLTTARHISRELDTAGVPPGTYFSYARISNGTTTRYFYFDPDGSGAISIACSQDAQCSDAVFCNGAERCVGGVCLAADNPCDGNAILPFCDEDAERCAECLDDNHCRALHTCQEGICVPDPYLEGSVLIDKALVKAGKITASDSIKLSGFLDATEAVLRAAIGGTVTVLLEADTIPGPGAIAFTFPLELMYLNNGKYASPKTRPVLDTDPVTSFKLDTKTGKFKFYGKGMDLTGLRCPITLTVTIGDYSAQTQLGEDMVNGLRKPCPLPLLMGVVDSIDVLKTNISNKASPAGDSVMLAGTFTAGGDLDTALPVTVRIGADTFTIGGALFAEKNGAYTCKKADSGNGLVTAAFNTVKCTYRLKIKNADVSGSGSVDFSMDVFGNNLLYPGSLDLQPE